MTNLWADEKRRAHSLNLLSTESQLNQSYEICLTIALFGSAFSWTLRVVSSSTWCGNIVTALPALCYSTSNAAVPLCRYAETLPLWCVEGNFLSTARHTVQRAHTVRTVATVGKAYGHVPLLRLSTCCLTVCWRPLFAVLQPSLCCTVILNEQQVSF